MSAVITLKDFSELSQYIDVTTLPPGPLDGQASLMNVEASNHVADLPDLDALLAELADASALLASVAQSDARVRTLALQDLERYDSMVAQAQDARAVRERADQVRQQAEAFMASAFGDEARGASDRVLRLAKAAEATARELAERRSEAAAELACRPDIQRLLDERRREAELERARAAEEARAAERTAALARVCDALRTDDLDQARRLLAPMIESEPEHQDVLAVRRQLAQRTFVLRAIAAEAALRTVRRRELRDDPSQAVALLAALDVTDLPEPLSRQLFGSWAKACRQLCELRELLEPLRFAPDPGRGMVVARERPTGPFVVVSALGMGAEWQVGVQLRTDPTDRSLGARRDREILRRSRPLR